jgi:hypothetical protein
VIGIPYRAIDGRVANCAPATALTSYKVSPVRQQGELCFHIFLLAFPTMVAPVSKIRLTTVASKSGVHPERSVPFVHRTPANAILSFTATVWPVNRSLSGLVDLTVTCKMSNASLVDVLWYKAYLCSPPASVDAVIYFIVDIFTDIFNFIHFWNIICINFSHRSCYAKRPLTFSCHGELRASVECSQDGPESLDEFARNNKPRVLA